MSCNAPKAIIRNRIIGVCTLVAVIGLMCMVAFRPFVFSPRNGVKPLLDGSGVAMREGIILGSDTLSKSDRALYSRRAITIELLITPVVRDIGKKQQILGFYDPQNRRSLRITQWRRYFIVESLRGNRWREIAFPLQCDSAKMQCITVASDANRTVLYANGRVMAEARYGIITASTIPSGRLLLGNNEHAQSPWSGHLHGCAIYAGCLPDSAVLAGSTAWLRRTTAKESLPLPLIRYSFSTARGKVRNLVADRHHLEIPERLIVLKRLFLVPLWKDWRVSYYYFMDVAVNVVGFMPFGFLVALVTVLFAPGVAARPGALCLVVLGAGAIFSLTIETVQVFLPRTSQMSDLIGNSIGSLFGCLSYILLYGGFRRGSGGNLPNTPA